jgi:hypothetical protein
MLLAATAADRRESAPCEVATNGNGGVILRKLEDRKKFGQNLRPRVTLLLFIFLIFFGKQLALLRLYLSFH